LADLKCIILRLPAGGPSETLPAGNLTMDANCNTSPALPLDKKGIKFRNNMLGQTIALSLNVRLGDPFYLDPPKGEPLADAPLNTEFCTWDGVSKDSLQSHSIPGSVLTALDTLGLPKTVGGLLELANLALAGQNTDGASLGDIHSAVGAINEAFDECRFLTLDCPE